MLSLLFCSWMTRGRSYLKKPTSKNLRHILYFTHMTVKIMGKGLEVLAEGLRRQVIPYIQEQHKSEFEARDEAHYVQSIKVGPAAEELGSWAG
jgi:hypothetical protein